jgi:methylenetetrahydrofolate dehydrogenase (NADP+)/methenyltetrahydrofolate cyclohydrolase
MQKETAVILDGNRIAAQIKAELAQQVKELATSGIVPGLAVILAGNDPASEIYVRSKIKACEQLGIKGELLRRDDSVGTQELVQVVDQFNSRDDIDGILVQLPLPAHVNASKVVTAIAPDKDVDGLHPMNIGNLSAGRPALVPCTPAGIMELLRRSDIPVEGWHAVVVGRSNIVGKPMSMLLLNANATVTICHSRTRNLRELTREADILVVAIGRAGFITGEHVKPGATVIDVGVNRITDPGEFHRLFTGVAERERSFAEKGSVVAGDVHPKVAELAGAITPVPGGVGPLTIAMLLANTVKACGLRRGRG